MSNRWGYASGRVVSIRLPDSVYATLEAKAHSKGLRLGEYVKDVLCKGASKIDADPTDSVNGSQSTPLYNPAIHRAGDTVLVKRGKSMVEATIPELDSDGYIVPDYY